MRATCGAISDRRSMLSGDVQIQVLMPIGFMGDIYFECRWSGRGPGSRELKLRARGPSRAEPQIRRLPELPSPEPPSNRVTFRTAESQSSRRPSSPTGARRCRPSSSWPTFRRRGRPGCSPRHGHQEVVDQVRVRAAVAAALQERQVLGVVNRRRLREPADRLRQQVREVRHLHALGNLRLGSGFAGVPWCGSPAPRPRPAATRTTSSCRRRRSSRGTAGPCRTGCASPRRTTSESLHLECRGLDGERAAVLRDQLLADPARAVADDVLGRASPSGSPGTG